jgi:hypothetical protein
MLTFHDRMVFSKVVDLHSYAEEVRTIYGSCASLPAALDSLFIQIGVLLFFFPHTEAQESDDCAFLHRFPLLFPQRPRRLLRLDTSLPGEAHFQIIFFFLFFF